MTRDMTKAQFKAACERYGFKPCGFMGYYALPGHAVQVSVLNAGRNRRAQLAFLIKRLREEDEKKASRGVPDPTGDDRGKVSQAHPSEAPAEFLR